MIVMLSMLQMIKGNELKATQKRLRLRDAEVCAEAGISIGTLHRVLRDHPRVTPDSVNKVSRAIEILRQKMVVAINSKAAG